MFRIAVYLIATMLLCSTVTAPVQAGTPPGFECGEYLDLAFRIVTAKEWATLDTITQEDCEGLFYRFDKMSRSALVEYLESGYFVNDLVWFEFMACEHFREYHCKDCDASLTCDEISKISEKYYYRKSFRVHWRNAAALGEHVTVIVTWLDAVISR